MFQNAELLFTKFALVHLMTVLEGLWFTCMINILQGLNNMHETILYQTAEILCQIGISLFPLG